MKKAITIIAIVIGSVGFVFFGLLTFNYFYNENTISKYEEHNYSQNLGALAYTNITQPYVLYYNNGNIHYQKGEYEEAIKDYKEALEYDPPHKGVECDIRVNLALAIVATLPEDYSAPQNVEQSIETLKEARDYLLEEDCAKDDEDGHDETAQELKEELDDLIEQLEQQQQSQGGEGKEDEEEPEEPEEQVVDNGQSEREDEIKEELQQIQEDAHQEREDTLQLYEEIETDTNYSNWGGVIW